MTVEEKLKILIEKRYGSLNNFCVTNGIPYSTLKSVLERGVNNSTIQSIIKICRPLNLDIDALSDGRFMRRRKTKQPPNDSQ